MVPRSVGKGHVEGGSQYGIGGVGGDIKQHEDRMHVRENVHEIPCFESFPHTLQFSFRLLIYQMFSSILLEDF